MKNYKAIIILILSLLIGGNTATAVIMTAKVEQDTYSLNSSTKSAKLIQLYTLKMGANKVYRIPEYVSYNGVRYTVETIGNKLLEGKSLRKVEIPATVKFVEYRAFFNAKIDSLIIEDSEIKLQTDYVLEEDMFGTGELYQSFGGTHKYIYYGRNTNLSGKQVTYNYSDGYASSYSSDTKTETIDISPNMTVVDLWGATATTINCVKSNKPLVKIHVCKCDSLIIDRNIDCNSIGTIGLKVLTFGDEVKSLQKGLLASFTNITALKISKTLTDFDPYEIKTLKGLTNLEIEDGNKAYALVDDILYNGDRTKIYYMFNPSGKTYDKITLPVTITSIPDSMFYMLNCNHFEAKGVTEVGESAFYSSVINEFDDDFFINLSKVGKGAFNLCYGITTLKLNSLAELCESAFCGTGIKSVEIDGPITAIPDSVFANCTALESIAFGENTAITEVGECGFMNCPKLSFGEDFIPGLEKIGAEAFRNTAITEVKLNEEVDIVYNSTFENCRKLTYADLGERVRSIGKDAFKNCDLRTVRLGSALRSVGDGAFNRNFNLENVYCNSTLAPEACDNSFLEGYDATLHVPKGARQRYMIAPGWRYFASIVQDESLSDVDEVTVDGEDVPAEYYDMQGRRVENPVHGIYIMRQGPKVEKVVL